MNNPRSSTASTTGNTGSTMKHRRQPSPMIQFSRQQLEVSQHDGADSTNPNSVHPPQHHHPHPGSSSVASSSSSVGSTFATQRQRPKLPVVTDSMTSATSGCSSLNNGNSGMIIREEGEGEEEALAVEAGLDLYPELPRLQLSHWSHHRPSSVSSDHPATSSDINNNHNNHHHNHPLRRGSCPAMSTSIHSASSSIDECAPWAMPASAPTTPTVQRDVLLHSCSHHSADGTMSPLANRQRSKHHRNSTGNSTLLHNINNYNYPQQHAAPSSPAGRSDDSFASNWSCNTQQSLNSFLSGMPMMPIGSSSKGRDSISIMDLTSSVADIVEEEIVEEEDEDEEDETEEYDLAFEDEMHMSTLSRSSVKSNYSRRSRCSFSDSFENSFSKLPVILGEGGFGNVYRCRAKSRSRSPSARSRPSRSRSRSPRSSFMKRQDLKREQQQTKQPRHTQLLEELQEDTSDHSSNSDNNPLNNSNSSNMDFAVKEVPSDKYNEDEIETLQQLVDCPQIVQLLHVFHEETVTYIVMEEMRGGNLLNQIAAKECYAEPDARVVTRTILQAVAFCHAHGIAHRDIKPENILIVDEEDDCHVKLADFGLAKRFRADPDDFYRRGDEEDDEDEYVLKTMCGSPIYAAPEVFRNYHQRAFRGHSSHGEDTTEAEDATEAEDDTDYRYTELCDMWSVGVVLYILLGGYAPFEAKDDESMMKVVALGEFEFHSKYWNHISKEAQDLITSLLQVNASQRLTATQALEHPWLKQGEEKET